MMLIPSPSLHVAACSVLRGGRGRIGRSAHIARAAMPIFRLRAPALTREPVARGDRTPSRGAKRLVQQLGNAEMLTLL
jgi:hypothetical protein